MSFLQHDDDTSGDEERRRLEGRLQRQLSPRLQRVDFQTYVEETEERKYKYSIVVVGTVHKNFNPNLKPTGSDRECCDCEKRSSVRSMTELGRCGGKVGRVCGSEGGHGFYRLNVKQDPCYVFTRGLSSSKRFQIRAIDEVFLLY
jgi:hypothetical protein